MQEPNKPSFCRFQRKTCKMIISSFIYSMQRNGNMFFQSNNVIFLDLFLDYIIVKMYLKWKITHLSILSKWKTWNLQCINKLVYRLAFSQCRAESAILIWCDQSNIFLNLPNCNHLWLSIKKILIFFATLPQRDSLWRTWLWCSAF